MWKEYFLFTQQFMVHIWRVASMLLFGGSAPISLIVAFVSKQFIKKEIPSEGSCERISRAYLGLEILWVNTTQILIPEILPIYSHRCYKNSKGRHTPHIPWHFYILHKSLNEYPSNSPQQPLKISCSLPLQHLETNLLIFAQNLLTQIFIRRHPTLLSETHSGHTPHLPPNIPSQSQRCTVITTHLPCIHKHTNRHTLTSFYTW